MTTNELAVTDIQFAVNYTPSKITIENEDQLDQLINQVTEHYGAQVFSDSNIPEAKEARAQLNKYVKAMEDRRKEIKREFTKPLTQFESVMKGYVEKITTISDDIGEGIKKYDEEQKAIRLEKIQAEMEKLAELFNVEPNVVEVHSNWLAKSAFTTKGEVRPKIIDEIKDKMKIIAMERERIAADKATVTDYAELAGLDPYAWSNLIEQKLNKQLKISVFVMSKQNSSVLRNRNMMRHLRNLQKNRRCNKQKKLTQVLSMIQTLVN